jgi:hypothetical protein
VKHFWIIEVNGNPERWAWRVHATAQGGLHVRAYRTKKEAGCELYEARRIYGHARLRKFVPA